MRIKRLEIVGFKSFADRARLNFGAGITGVVGPNGCGKSNVVDAIRWCMGEMSAKHLRGRAMQDVIFAGADNRGPMGMAEVTLTFDNDGNVPPTYASYTEIAVTRRLHRDGTSEYFINKVPVRLRDITDLFLGTGVGTRAYSIIEQGRIGFVVNSRPEERRTLIEEVAGITKFKVRKKAAEKRMEATEQNLARVNDIVTELERQLGTLRRQAKKAERYKELRAELRDVDLHIASMEYLRVNITEQHTKSMLHTLDRQISDASYGLVSDESTLEAERIRLLEEEKRLQREQALSSELDARLAGLDRDLEHWRRQLTDTRQLVELAGQEIEETTYRLSQVSDERTSTQQQTGELEKQVVDDRAAIERMQHAMQDLHGRLAAVDEELEILRKSALEHVQGAAKQRTHAANLERQRFDLRARLHLVTHEQDDLLPKQAAAQVRCTDLEQRRKQSAQELENAKHRQALLREEFETLTRQVKESATQLARAKDALSDKRSRLTSLEEIARRLEGYSDGVRTLRGAAVKKTGKDAKGAVADQTPVPGLHALVTEVLQVPSQFERAIEGALGEKLQYFIVQSPESGALAVEHLKKVAGGRGGFMAKGLRAGKSAFKAVMPEQAGVIGRAAELVSAPDEHRAIVDYLLGSTLLVSDLATAIELWTHHQDAWTYVTLAGEVLDAAGVLTGGSANGAGLLASQREIRELHDTVEQLNANHVQAQTLHTQYEERRAVIDDELRQVSAQLHSAEVVRVSLEKDADAAALDVKRLGERLEVVKRDSVQISEKLASIDEEEAAALRAAEKAEAGKQDTEWKLAELQERRQIEAGYLNGKNDEITAVKVRLAARDEQLSSVRAHLKRLDSSEAELNLRLNKARGTIETGRETVVDLQERLRKGETLAKQTATEAQSRREALVQARGQYETELENIAQRERSLKELRRGNETLQESAVRLKMDMQRLTLERQRLLDSVLERHDLDLRTIIGDYHARALPGGDDFERRNELEKSIRNMGPINLTAIEECAEVEGRFTFLSRQRDDLQEALDALKRAIVRINKASRERFQEAFDAVNQMFQKVYPRLFRGGVARLELTHSDDLLEAGVDIIAQPPGKKLQNVGLLSGGEKALTATALVFAIFLIKPSPFCILDEVDAPLDEANVGRFNELLREISKFSQFIVITHNKQSMQQAHQLYGITMEEPGMSKVVSVDIDQRGSSTQAA